MSIVTTPITASVVDPSDGLRLSVNDEQPSKILGDSSISNSFSSWTVSGASSSTASTGLTAVAQAAGTPVAMSLSGITATATPLEYAYYDYIQISLALPTNYAAGPITFYYGTNDPLSTAPSQSGISLTNANRQFTIPASQVEGGTHVYRINVGKLVFWEGYLTDLEVSIPTATAGQTESLNYAEFGDLPNSTIAVSPTTQNIGNPAGYLQYPTTANGGAYNLSPTDGTWHSVQSKHFVYYYDTAGNPGGYASQAVAAHNALEILEQAQRIYTQALDFGNAFGWAKGLNGDTTLYKVNVTSWFGGSFSGGFYLNIDSGQTEDTTGPGTGYTDTEEPLASAAHEFGHVTDSQNNNYLAGGHFESHANWYREQWINWYSAKWALDGDTLSSYEPFANYDSNLRQDDQRLIYSDWRVYTPLEYYAGSLGLDPDLVTKLWTMGGTNLTLYDKLAEILPQLTNTNNLSVKDIAAKLMAYWPTLDFPVRADMESGAFAPSTDFTTAQQLANFDYETTSPLDPDADDTGWYTVPYDRAPESYGYMTHVLTPTAGSTSVSVTVKGLPSSDSTADWRYVLEDVSNCGTLSPTVNTYSQAFDNGQTGTISLASSSDKVLLVVTATPGNTTLDLTDFDNTARDTQAATRQVYPYEVSLTGATPATGTAEQIAYARSGSGAYHLNPDGTTGGWVDSTATVASTAYVAPGAEVLGTAKVSGTSRILDYAVVSDSATVSGSAIVEGYAVATGSASISGSARIEDHAFVGSGASINGNAVIEEYAYVPGYIGDSVLVTDNAVVRGEAEPTGGTLSGSAIVEYDYTSNYTLSTAVHDNNHPYDDFSAYYDDTEVTPPGLIASYRINETSTTNPELYDEFGTLNAELRGTPTRINDTTLNSQVLSLDGSTQYAILDRSVADLTDGTYSFVVNPAVASQPLLYFGSSAATYLKLVAHDANGFAQLTISVNGTVETLESTVAVPLSSWTNLSLTFASGVATFYINGVAAGTTGSTGSLFRPTNVLTSDASTSALSLFLGRDASGNLFKGELDDIRVYNVALTAAQLVAEIGRTGTVLGSNYTTAPATFNGSSTTAQSGVPDGLVRTISAYINPTASPSETDSYLGTAYYTPIVDSTDERYYPPSDGKSVGLVNGSGLGLDGGYYYAKLDGYGMWNTGVAVALNAWSQVTLTFDGSTANFYLNGVLRATQAYTATAADVVGKDYRIGYGQTTTATSSQVFFSGQIFDVTISDRVVSPADITLPAGYTVADIGSPNAGTTAFGSGTFVVGGGGNTGVAGTTDKFRYTYTNLATSGQITALVAAPVASGTGTVSTSATSGIMVRATSAANAVNAYLSLTPGGTVAFTYRSTSGAATTTNGSISTTAGNAVYLRLVRSGTGISAYYSTDNVTYIEVGSTVTLASLTSTALAGFAVSSRSSSALAQGVFTNVSITASAEPTIASGPTVSNVTATTANLSVLGSDPAGESTLTYRWSTVGNVAAPVSFSANATNAAKNTTVTFYATGTYTFMVSAYDASGLIVNSSTSSATITSVPTSVSPANASVIGGGAEQFAVSDQFGSTLTGSGLTWSTSIGSISSTGLFTAPATGTLATVSATFNGTSAYATVTVVTPILYYRNDAISASTSVADSSGNGYNGTITGTYGSTYSSTTGEIGKALNLSGSSTSNGYVTLPSSFAAAMSKTTDFTISGWVKEKSVNDWARLFDFGNTTSTQYMFLTPADGGGDVRFAITNSGGSGEQVVYSSTVLSTGTWNFLAVTLAGSTATLYVNGVVVGTNTAVSLNPAVLGVLSHDYIGKSLYGDPQLQGAVDDFRVYNTAASAGDILSLYNTGVATAGAMPAITTAAAATPSPVTGKTTTLTVGAAESGGSSVLTYTWTTTSTPTGGSATFDSNNGTAAGTSTVATFTKAGTYAFLVTVADSNGTSVTSAVTVLVSQTASTVIVSPVNGTILSSGATQQFTAVVTDQFGAAMTATVTWSATGGTVTGAGLFTAGSTAGAFSVTATFGNMTGTATGNVAASFPTTYPASAGDGFFLRLASDGITEQLWVGTPGMVGPAYSSTPTYSTLLSNLPSLSFGPGSSADGTLTVDDSNGSPIPAGGVSYDGGAGTDTLNIIGGAGNDVVNVGATTITLDSGTITYANTEVIAVTLGAGTNTLTQNSQPGGHATLSLLDPTASDTLNVNGGTYTFAAPTAGEGIVQLPLASLVVASSAKVSLSAASSHSDRYLLELGSISVAGILDLGTSDLDLQTVSPSALGTIQSLITQGYNGGLWNGTSGILSSAAAVDSKHLTALGYLQNNQSGPVLFTSTNPFDGVVPGSSDILIKYTYYGDANLDGSVDGSDYSRSDNGFLTHLTGWFNGDFNYDGLIDGSDYTLIDNAFDTQGASVAAAISYSPGRAIAAAMPDSHSTKLTHPSQSAIQESTNNFPDYSSYYVSEITGKNTALARFSNTALNLPVTFLETDILKKVSRTRIFQPHQKHATASTISFSAFDFEKPLR